MHFAPLQPNCSGASPKGDIMKKALPYILYSLVILAAAGLLIYQGLVAKNLESSNFVKGILIIAAAFIGMVRPKRQRKVSNKKPLYQNVYKDFIQNAFCNEPKLEKEFYNAVDDYNFGRFASGVDKLAKLRKECQRTADIYAVTVFTALCYDGMLAYKDAVKWYEDANQIRRHTTLLSNSGMCYLHLGQLDAAEEAYHKAIEIDENNAFAWNNLSGLYFKLGDYERSLEYAETAIEINAQLPQALGCAAICSALLGNDEEYRNYYRRAVAAGYDGSKIKNAIAALDPD